MSWKETIISAASWLIKKALPWLTKVALLLLGLYTLLYPDFAPYLRAIGFVATAVAVLSFRTTQQRLLAERGIRIPNLVIGVLLIGMFGVTIFIFPGADDLVLTDERAELTGSEVVYEANLTNTGDGTILDPDITVYLNNTDGSIAETQVLGNNIGRGQTTSFTARFQLDNLDAETRSSIKNDSYEIYILMDPNAFQTNSHTYSP